MRKMRVALAQMDILDENTQANQIKAEEMIKEALRGDGKGKPEIMVFPEMTLTGFSMNVKKTTADWMDQRAFFRDMSLKYGLTLAAGYPARPEAVPVKTGEERIYQNHLSIFEGGRMLLDYVKIHPFSYGKEAAFFVGGDRIVTLPWHKTVLGGFICYDLRFPELFQISSASSEIIFVIACWPRARIRQWDILLQARAIENQCYIVAVNRTGSDGIVEYNGHSAVYSPYGDRLTESSEKEQVLLADLDLDELRDYRRCFPVKKDRREDLYRQYFPAP